VDGTQGVCVVSGVSVMSGMSCHDSHSRAVSAVHHVQGQRPRRRGSLHVLVQAMDDGCARCCGSEAMRACVRASPPGSSALCLLLLLAVLAVDCTAHSQLRPAAAAAAAARRAGYCISIMRCFVRPVLILPHPPLNLHAWSWSRRTLTTASPSSSSTPTLGAN
jgi:hypothetical protein